MVMPSAHRAKRLPQVAVLGQCPADGSGNRDRFLSSGWLREVWPLPVIESNNDTNPFKSSPSLEMFAAFSLLCLLSTSPTSELLLSAAAGARHRLLLGRHRDIAF